MFFNSLFIAQSPDADPDKHQAKLETGVYRLYVRLVKNQTEALDIVTDIVESKKIHCITLCPGFTNEQVAEISQVAGPEVGVTVARGDGPGNKIARKAMERAGWFD